MDAKSVLKNLYEIIKTIAVMFLLAFLIRGYLIQTFVVEGRSMEPNFHDGEYLLIDKISYRFKAPQRGDVIVFLAPEEKLYFIKRIIGLPGESLEITHNTIYINGQKLPEPYLSKGEQTLVENNFLTDFKTKINSDQYFVLGDNRQNSKDSRSIGLVSRQNIAGRAFVVVYPFQYFGLVHLPSYIKKIAYAPL